MEHPAFIYAILVNDAVKIGYAKRPRRRLGGIQSSLPVAIADAVCVEVHEEDKAKIEAKLHKKFRSKRARGEWFHISMDEAAAALAALGTLHYPLSPEWSDPETPTSLRSEIDLALIGMEGERLVKIEIANIRKTTIPWTELWWRGYKPGYWRARTWNHP